MEIKNNSVAAAKKLLRQDLKSRLSALYGASPATAETWSVQAAGHILNSSIYADAETVLAFLSYGSEINTDFLVRRILADGRRLAVPRIVPGTADMKFHFIDPKLPFISQIVSGSYGIPEPLEILPAIDKADFPEHAIVIVPGLAFTSDGRRLGKGKGFYDRYLRQIFVQNSGSRLPLAVAGFCFSLQIVDSVPYDTCDVLLTHLVCETGVRRCSGLSAF